MAPPGSVSRELRGLLEDSLLNNTTSNSSRTRRYQNRNQSRDSTIAISSLPSTVTESDLTDISRNVSSLDSSISPFTLSPDEAQEEAFAQTSEDEFFAQDEDITLRITTNTHTSSNNVRNNHAQENNMGDNILAARMPYRKEKNAPSFDGTPGRLRRYLEDIDDLAGIHGLEDADKIKYAIYYCDEETEEMLQLIKGALPEGRTNDWAEFTKEVKVFFIGAETTPQKYSLTSIERFVDAHSAIEFGSREDVVEYIRDFKTQALSLKAAHLISDNEIGRLFLRGLSSSAKRELLNRLQIVLTKHHPSTPYPLQDLCDNLLWLSEGGPVINNSTNTSMCNASPAIKNEPTDLGAFAEAVKGLTTAFTMMAQNQNYAQPTRARGPPPTSMMGPNGAMRAPRNLSCNFCSSPDHFVRGCPKVEEYLRLGKCIRNTEGNLTLPNGFYVPRYIEGRNMMEKFDAYAAQAQNFAGASSGGGPPVVSNNIFSISDPSVLQYVKKEADADISEEEEELERLSVLTAEVKRKIERKKREVMDGVEIRKGPPGVPAKDMGVKKVAQADLTKKPAPASFTKDAQAPPNAAQPQFKYQTPVEDPALVQSVLQRALEGKVELTQRELLAIAPDLRKQIKEMTTTKRVATGVFDTVNSLINEAHLVTANTANMSSSWTVEGDGLVTVAQDSLPLRVIDALIEGKLTVECIIDPGSQIVAMRKEIWEQLGVPLQSDMIMVMEAANKTKTSTMGLLQNLRMTFGPVELMLQVQVVENAPFDILLGRPFQALASCTTKDFPTGEQYITLKDPNTAKEVMIPTRTRGVQEKKEAGF